jgi:hypothetical protein
MPNNLGHIHIFHFMPFATVTAKHYLTRQFGGCIWDSYDKESNNSLTRS